LLLCFCYAKGSCGGHHSITYSVFLHSLMLCIRYLGGHVCVKMASGGCYVGCIVVPGLAVVFGVSGSFVIGWSRALSVPFDVDMYGLFCWWSELL
jgi:hypothetical protein